MLDEDLLEHGDGLVEADRGGLLLALAGAGAQIRHSADLAREVGVDQLSGLDRPRVVVVLAAGPAAVCGEVLVALCGPTGAAPVVVVRDPDRLPLWVGAADVVFGISHTGVEPGLLTALDGAMRRGAAVVGVGPADSPMREACARGRAQWLPTAGPLPQLTTLWGVLAPTLIAANAAGLASVGATELQDTADTLDQIAERCRPSSEPFVNPAKTLALELALAAPLACGGTALAGVAAHRMATQLASFAAVPAVSGTLPGAAHDWAGLLAAPPVGDIFRDRVEEPEMRRVRLVLLRDPDEPAPLTSLIEQVRRMAEDRGVLVSELAPEGSGPVPRFGSLAALGDFTAAYLGLASGVNPAGVRLGED